MKPFDQELKPFFLLWSTQSLSQLGSAMTNFALTLWLYQQTGSALQTALLSICSYAPYVCMSIFAGALSDRWDKRRVIVLTMLVSLGTENFLLAFTRTPLWWCVGQLIGWLLVPLMNANLDVILRSTIPVGVQGRVYACRNTLQFFTIPVGCLLGGWLVDAVCEPVMAAASPGGLLTRLFGSGKGSGAAVTMLLLGVLGVLVCLIFGRLLRRFRFSDARP